MRLRPDCRHLPWPNYVGEPADTPKNNNQWVPGKSGVVNYSSIKALVDKNLTPPLCHNCKHWGHEAADCNSASCHGGDDT